MKDKNPLISIISPTYNHEKYIGKCINSVLDQTFKNWEMIIIDDKSQDSTTKIINHFSDNRIILIEHENNYGLKNLSKTYNEALKIANGDYIAILEGDDFWPVKKLEQQIACFNYENIVLSYGRWIIVDKDDNELKEFFVDKKYSNLFSNKSSIVYEDLLVKDFFIQSSTVLIKKDYLLKIGGFLQPEEIELVDYPTFLELSLLGKFFGFSDFLGYNRRHASNSSVIKILEITEKKIFIMDSSVKKNDYLLQNNSSFKLKFINNKNCEMIYAYWIRGRNFNKNKKFLEAQVSFIKGILFGAKMPVISNNLLKNKIKCIVGLIFNFFHLDLKKIINLIPTKKSVFFD